MSCSRIHLAISARLDGEPTDVDERALDAHLAQCGDCRDFLARAEQVHRAVRLAPAPDVPDLTASILAAVAAQRPAGTEPALRSGTEPVHSSQERGLRLVLAAIGLVQIAIALPALLLGSDAELPVHTARHLGSFDVALGVGFLFAAWRPARIPGILPIAAALVLCLLGSALLDVFSGAAAAGSEAHHATAFAGLVVVWLLSRTATARGTTTGVRIA